MTSLLIEDRAVAFVSAHKMATKTAGTRQDYKSALKRVGSFVLASADEQQAAGNHTLLQNYVSF